MRLGALIVFPYVIRFIIFIRFINFICVNIFCDRVFKFCKLYLYEEHNTLIDMLFFVTVVQRRAGRGS